MKIKNQMGAGKKKFKGRGENFQGRVKFKRRKTKNQKIKRYMNNKK